MHKAIEKGLEIIPVRVEESESGASDFARDTISMWPDATIEKHASSNNFNDSAHSTKLEEAQLQRLMVTDKLVSMNTFPPRGSLFGDDIGGLQDLISQVQVILTKGPSPSEIVN